MLKKSLLAATALIYSSTCFAQTPNVEEMNRNMVESANELNRNLNQTMQQVTEGMNRATESFTQATPQITTAITTVMNELFNIMAVTVVAIEENKKLPQMTPEMFVELKQALPEKYTQITDFDINKDTNEGTLNGVYQKDDHILKYTISRNLGKTYMLNSLMNKDLSGSAGTFLQPTDDEGIPLNRVKKETIDGKDFLALKDTENEKSTYFGNIGAYLNINIVSKGKNHQQLADDFIKSLNYDAIRKAVQDDGKSLSEISLEIEMKAKDPEVLQNLFKPQTTQEGN